ncbi:MAG: ABC transporter ATP-binding protein [Bdellovibrionales bacterium]
MGCLTTPTSGKILIGGRDVSGMSDQDLSAFRAKSLGFVFQNFNLLPVLSAVENVEYTLLGFPMSRQELREKALSALSLVGLSAVEKHRPDQLSGGQRQRVAIARAFVHAPQLIIADEPTANLDKKTAGEILDLMVRLNETTGSTVIIATHDPIAMARAKRKVEISDGKIL